MVGNKSGGYLLDSRFGGESAPLCFIGLKPKGYVNWRFIMSSIHTALVHGKIQYDQPFFF